jgi:hypothetical protein
MAVWILTRITPRLNAALQIVIVLTMNALEALLVPELLLFGRWNALFALLFCLLIAYDAFRLEKTGVAT